MSALSLVISGLGIHLICGTKIKAAGQAIVAQLEFNRPLWNRTDLQEIKIEMVMEPVRFGSWELQRSGGTLRREG